MKLLCACEGRLKTREWKTRHSHAIRSFSGSQTLLCSNFIFCSFLYSLSFVSMFLACSWLLLFYGLRSEINVDDDANDNDDDDKMNDRSGVS